MSSLPATVLPCCVGGLLAPSGDGDDRGVWLAAKPAEHSRICWAAAIGRARNEYPQASLEQLPAAAVRVLADGQCLCRRQRGHTRGRRQI
ncbi:hypothetical protein GCM10011594_42420 [Nakamurella endophytica]|uniref:Uncharacterized protein n=1 Tax=Nakamurella endophytica TaxID=1748367 RepID=A0A917WP00_9ACTN|nr:hypothetical protein GCM10011594_42420 [Nakamurella endophytica]